MKRSLNLAVCLGLAVTTGCTTTLPTLGPPSRTLPKLDMDPPPAEDGKGRVSFDSENVPGASVEMITGSSSSIATAGTVVAVGWSQSTAPVCKAPCVANLPYGNYAIKFSAPDGYSQLVDIKVAAAPTVVRANLGHFKHASIAATAGGIVLACLGGSTAITGLAFLPVDSGVGLPLTLVGGLVTALGGVILEMNSNEAQEGQGIQYQPSDGKIY